MRDGCHNCKFFREVPTRFRDSANSGRCWLTEPENSREMGHPIYPKVRKDFKCPSYIKVRVTDGP